VWAEDFDEVFESVMRRALDDWNALVEDVLGVTAFVAVEHRERADIIVTLGPRPMAGPLGRARGRGGADGVITLPIAIRIFGPRPLERWRVDRETLLYRIVTHELGHALGLPHVREPRSLMCCDRPGDFADRMNWAAYMEALRAYEEAIRHPNVRWSASSLPSIMCASGPWTALEKRRAGCPAHAGRPRRSSVTGSGTLDHG
jgi:Matrixin